MLGLSNYGDELRRFWPKGGPRWDALAVAQMGAGGVVLVEAKSHVAEMYAGGCKATSPKSIKMIADAIANTKHWLRVDDVINWQSVHRDRAQSNSRSGNLYQTANRLAHLYFFREILRINSWLVNIFFVDDPHSPTTQIEWESALAKAKRTMGLTRVPFAVDIFLPALSALESISARTTTTEILTSSE